MRQPCRWTRRTPRIGTALLATTALLALTAGCGDDPTRASDPASPEGPSSPEGSSTPGGTSSPGGSGSSQAWTTGPDGERVFTATDYAYRLEVLCFCPITGPVEVEVADGEVVAASVARTGEEAPEFTRLSIGTILDRAAELPAGDEEVTWPSSSDWPTQVGLDPQPNAIDDELTYRISRVRFAG